MPKLFSTPHRDRIERVYNEGSIHVPNKYIVGLWGEAVVKAIQYMSDYAVIDPLIANSYKVSNDERIYSGILIKWLRTHCPGITITPASFNNEYGRDIIQSLHSIELLWACEKITFPGSVIPTFNDKIMLDTYKNVKYPIITGHSGPGSITLQIIEDRTLMFYQFFNAIMNQFFDPLILKARSSIHKMGLYMISLDGFDHATTDLFDERDYLRGLDDNGQTGWSIADVPLQVFEFNSIVPESIGDIDYGYGEEKKATYTVKFKAPNMFQDAFKTMGNFRGMANNTTDKPLLRTMSLDEIAVSKSETSIKYNTGMFEESSHLPPPANGRYTDFIGE